MSTLMATTVYLACFVGPLAVAVAWLRRRERKRVDLWIEGHRRAFERDMRSRYGDDWPVVRITGDELGPVYRPRGARW